MSVPATVSRYEIKQELGRGAMGTLYLALDPLIDRLVAVKLLRVDTEELRSRFLREARAGGRLQHKNIVTFYDVGVHDDQPFIAMEYIKGETLAEIISRKATLSLDRKLKLIEELCDGLGYAHDAGLIHRDIKPANLMVTEGAGELKILDFGIARVTDLTGLTQAGGILGTMHYMSPEQAQGRPLDHRSDIFAVGAVLYEILTYRRAFAGRDLRDVLQFTPVPIAQLAPSLDPVVDDVIERALLPEPEDRYQHLRELAKRLTDVRAGVSARPSDDQRRADMVAGQRRASTDATQVESYLSSAQTQLGQRNLAKALTLVNRALDVERTQAGVELQQRVLLAIEDSEKGHERAASVGRSLRAGRENLESGALKAAIRAANEVLAYDPKHPEAVELKQRALKAGEGQRSVEVETTVLQTDRTSDEVETTVLQTGRTSTRWLSLAAAIVFASLSVGALVWLALPNAEDVAVAEALALYDAGERAAAFARLEAFDPPRPVVTEELAELRARWTFQAEELAMEAKARADDGDVDGAVAMLSDFAPPHDSITAVLEELRVQDSEDTQSAIETARVFFDNGERQEAFDVLQNVSPATPEVQEALALLTVRWEQQAEALALSARTRAENGDLDGAITGLEGFAPSHEAVRVALAEFRGRLGNREAARRTAERAGQLFEEGERFDAFRILDEFSPSHEIVDAEAQRLRQELDRLAQVEVNEARRLAADSRLGEAVDRLGAFTAPNALVTAALNELRSELDVRNAAQITVDDARRIASNGEWSRAFILLQNFTPAALVADALEGLRAEWDRDGQVVAQQAQSLADEGDLAGALRELAQFQGDHPAVEAVEAQVVALVNAPPPSEPGTTAPLERGTTDPPVNVEARLLALSNQAEDIVARFIELYEDLDAEGMTSVWTTASTEDLAPLADTFKSFRSASVEHQDCDPELRNETRAVVYCSVAVEYQPIAGARLQMPAVGWQFELEWTDDERWQMVNWSR